MVASLFLNLRSQFLDKNIGGTYASVIPANKQHYSQQMQRLFLPPGSNTRRYKESQELPVSCGLLAQSSRNLCHFLVSGGGTLSLQVQGNMALTARRLNNIKLAASPAGDLCQSNMHIEEMRRHENMVALSDPEVWNLGSILSELFTPEASADSPPHITPNAVTVDLLEVCSSPPPIHHVTTHITYN